MNSNTLQAAQAKAQVLIDALPWIRQFAGGTVVIKYGGNAMISPELKEAFALDVAFLHHVGMRPIVVHGGGPQINEMLTRLGIDSEFKAGLRVTSEEAMDVVRMVLTGKVQRELVSLINRDAPYAVGLSGEDAGLLRARKRRVHHEGRLTDIGQVGDIVDVNPAPILELLAADRIPVISTVATDVDELGILNVNADTAAASIAVAVRATKLLMLTDVEGLYTDWPDRASLVPRITTDELAKLLPSLDAGMRPKMEGAMRAVQAGVQAAHVIDGRMAHSMLLEVFTGDGVGTIVEEA